MAGMGHNSRGADTQEDVLSGTAQRQLKSIIERIERQEAEKADIAEGIKETYAEAKGNGYDVKVLRKIVRLRKMDPAKRAEEEAVLDLYETALAGPSSEADEDDYDDIA